MARILNLFDKRNTIDWLPDLFGRGAKDLEWIPEAAKIDPKPVIVGGDGRILKNRVECAALKTSAMSFVYLASGWTGLSWNERVPKMVKAWPAIVSECSLLRRPAVLGVSVGSGKVTRTRFLQDL